MLDAVYKDTKARMSKSVEAVSREFTAVRTGKASPSLLDTVRVEAYGTQMPINQLATIATPEPRLLVLQAFDKSTVGAIVKGIQVADLGFNPVVDGQTIRIPIPPLNEERRKEMVKRCKTIAEEGRVSVRNIRRDSNDVLKKGEKDKEISEDELKKGLDEIQKFTDDFIKKIDELLERKDKDLMEV
jgi:ribosome recycling factor